jgi:hypothetical protein
MKFAQEIWLLPDCKPVIVGELHQNPVLVAVVDEVQISRLVIELEIVDAQSFGVPNINWGLHLSVVAQFRPMAWTEGSRIICELRVTLFLSHGHVQVVVVLLSMLPMFNFLGKLGHLADAGWGRDEDGETQGRERQHANASYPITGHEQWPPI